MDKIAQTHSVNSSLVSLLFGTVVGRVVMLIGTLNAVLVIAAIVLSYVVIGLGVAIGISLVYAGITLMVVRFRLPLKELYTHTLFAFVVAPLTVAWVVVGVLTIL